MPRTDLNLLVVLDSLLEECSVSKVAKKLNVTPPAISKSLNKLRDSFQDQLLVRSGSMLILTPLATQLRPQIRSLINNIDSVLNQNLSFDIGRTRLTFSIASNDLTIAMLNSGMLQELQEQEQSVVLDFSYDHGSVDFLRKDNIDLYIGEPRQLSPEIKIRTIHRDRCLLIANKTHEIFSLAPILSNLANCDFISTKGRLNEDVDAMFNAHGYQRKIVGISPGYLTTLETVLRTNTLAVVPTFFMQAIGGGHADAIAFEPENRFPEVNLIQAWHPRHDNSPSHKWLRDYTKDFLSKKIGSAVY
ncbi:Nodulation protein D 2 [Serratia ficaria]|uniref:LysR substrate-binding domain-containing protein n=1 Tax=Serratia ficaria TaxID=61651 RepID=UPI0021790470|nr:LysR substrate-binding domain-containing protein [Serratia ficaria]CAI1705809.1 Nodulation protein D 2 [Serratia ficaria]